MKRDHFQLIPKVELDDDPLFFLRNHNAQIYIPGDIYDALICVYRISKHEDPLANWKKMNKLMFNHHIVNIIRRRSLVSSNKAFDLKRNRRKYKHLCFGEISHRWNLDPKLTSIVMGIIESFIHKDYRFYKRNPNRLRKEKHLKKMDEINKRASLLKEAKLKKLSPKPKKLLLWNPFKGLFKEPYVPTVSGGNNNFFILGEKNAGQHFLCTEIIRDVLAEGGNVLVFDDSDNYKNLCEVVGGQYITENNLSLLGIDFFKLLPEKGVENFDQYWSLFDMLTTLLILMTGDDYELCDADHEIVRLALVSVWKQKGQEANLLDVIKNLDQQENATASKIALGLTKFDKRYNDFFKKSPHSLFEKKLTVVNFKGLDNPLLHAVMTSLLMGVFHHQKEDQCLKPFLVLFEDYLLPDPLPPFESVINNFSLGARLQRISLGKVSSQIENITDGSEKSNYLYRPVHYSSRFDMAFWRNSSWHIFFEGRYRCRGFIERTRSLFSKEDVQKLWLLSGHKSIAIRGETQDLKRYTLKIKGENYATAA